MTDDMFDLKFHPAADVFPMMDDDRLNELVRDIRKNGLIQPITLCDGMVLDGRNRLRACSILRVKPRFQEYEGNPWDYVWSLNGARRDLPQVARALIWKQCQEGSEAWKAVHEHIVDEANRKRSETAGSRARRGDGTFEPVVGDNPPPLVKEHKSRKARAAAAGVGEDAIKRADVLAKRRPDLAEKVVKGDLTPAAAQKRMEAERAGAEEVMKEEKPAKVRKRDTVPSRFRYAVSALRREVELIVERNWSGVNRAAARRSVAEIIDLIDAKE